MVGLTKFVLLENVLGQAFCRGRNILGPGGGGTLALGRNFCPRTEFPGGNNILRTEVPLELLSRRRSCQYTYNKLVPDDEDQSGLCR